MYVVMFIHIYTCTLLYTYMEFGTYLIPDQTSLVVSLQVYLYEYVLIYIFSLNTCTCIILCVHICICMYIYKYMLCKSRSDLLSCVPPDMGRYVFIFIYVCMYIYICVHSYAYIDTIHAYVDRYKCMYIYTYMYTYVYLYVFKSRSVVLSCIPSGLETIKRIYMWIYILFRYAYIRVYLYIHI
jgi:hypothetical protein